MNKFAELAKLLRKHNLKVTRRKCHDSQSGWTGANLYLRNENGYLNEDGSYSEAPKWGTLDLSGNGYCFNEGYIAGRITEIEDFFKFQELVNITTMGELNKFVRSITIEEGLDGESI